MLLLGNIGCVYTGDFCGEFFCKRAVIEEGNEYENIQGYELEIDFSNPFNCTPNDIMKEFAEWYLKYFKNNVVYKHIVYV